MPNRPLRRVSILEATCLRCGHKWLPESNDPRRCPQCGDPNWDKPRKFTRPDLRRKPAPVAPGQKEA